MGVELSFGLSVEETAESIATLRRMNEHDTGDVDDIRRIYIYFGTSFRFLSVLMPRLQELQELLFATLNSNQNRTIKSFQVENFADNAETNNLCYIFLSRYLEGSQDRIKQFAYIVKGRIPMTVNDATRFASIISRSNCTLESLIFRIQKVDHFNFVFLAGNTFELIFTAVLDKGLLGFIVGVAVTEKNYYYKKLIQRACYAGQSKLATNTSLKNLTFFLYNDERDHHFPTIHFDDNEIDPLLTIIKTNTGLDRIRLDGIIILSTATENNLMNAVRDNTTLTRGLFIGPPKFKDAPPSYHKLMSATRNEMWMNRFWKNFTTHYKIVGDKNTRNDINNNTSINNANHRENKHNINNNGNGDDIINGNINDDSNGNGDNVVPNTTQTQQEKPTPKPKTIELSMYPILLKKLTGKPQFLYQFLKSESSLLFQVVGDLDPLVATTRDDDDNTNDAVE